VKSFQFNVFFVVVVSEILDQIVVHDQSLFACSGASTDLDQASPPGIIEKVVEEGLPVLFVFVSRIWPTPLPPTLFPK
jgi:hypothetical protein